MPGISIHVVDVSRGIVAIGMTVELHATDDNQQSKLLIRGTIDKSGVLADPSLLRVFNPSRYRAVFHIGEYYGKSGIESGSPPFLDVVIYDFGISDPEQHIHLPFKCTPWGYSCFRGGS